MPIYEFQCECGKRFDRLLKLADYKEPQYCDCGKQASKRYSIPHIINAFQPYQSPIDGSVISSEKRRRDDLAKSGCIPYEPGMRQDVDQRVKDDEIRLEKRVDETVDRLISEMPSHKKEKLQTELGYGADIVYERRGPE